ncbi:MAG TPA: hypothetical protein VGJ14_18795 [Sporichthyaceae bacterium]
MRVYLPLTWAGLAGAAQRGGLPPGTGFAVTPALREWYASGDAEELEFAAMGDAAQECLRLLAADPTVPRRRVVVAADVPDPDVLPAPDRHPAVVLIGAAVPMRIWASVHVDDPSAVADVTAAAEAIVAADRGDDDAQFTVDGAADHALQWYAVQEIAGLLAAG